jgi:polyhydroxyalkanoate synthase
MSRNPNAPPPHADRFARKLAGANAKFAEAMSGEGASQQVMAGFAEAYRAWLEALSAKPETMLDLQGKYMQEQMGLWMKAMQPDGEAGETSDKRFAAPEWNELPVFRYFRDSYLLTSKMMMQAVEQASLDEPTKQRMRFFMRQYLDAAAPSNYLMTNPEALKAAIESRGETLQEGMKNLLADMEKGRISMTDESAFEVGRNIAVTPGSVVFQSELLQLIQYAADDGEGARAPAGDGAPVHQQVLPHGPAAGELAGEVRRGAGAHGLHGVVAQREAEAGEEDVGRLHRELIEALEEARRITKADRINALGFCIGGTLIASALAVLEKRRKDFVVSLTLLTSLLEFSDVGEIRVYIDENFVGKREKQLAKGGLVPGQELAGAFSSLRANDLVWSYVVNNYLKGKQPPAFDLLYWNADATNLPGPDVRVLPAQHLPGQQALQARCAHDAGRAGELEAPHDAGFRFRRARGPHRAVARRVQERAHPGREGRDVRAGRERATSRARSTRPQKASAATG